MRHLRFLVFVLLFCLLPVGLIHFTLTAWLDDTREARRSQYLTRVEQLVLDGRDRILSGTTKLELAQSILDEIEKRGEYVGGVVQEILSRWEERYPGVLDYQAYHVSVKLGTNPWETVRSIPLANNIGKDIFAYEKLAEHLMRYRLWLERDTSETALAPELPEARKKMIQKKILGEHRSLAYVSDRFRDAIPVNRDGRESTLYWDFLYDIDADSGQRTPMGLVVLFIDPAAFREQFQPQKILARINDSAGIPGLKLGWYQPASGSEPGSSTELTPDLRAIAMQAGAVTPERHEDNGILWSFLRQSSHHSGILHARIDIAAIHPETDRLALWLNGALTLFVIIFLLIAIPVQYGQFQFFFSLRYQVAALFLLAALPPLIAIMLGGARYLRASRDLISESVLLTVQDRLKEADESARSSLAALQQKASLLLESKELIKLAAQSSESNLLACQDLLTRRQHEGEFRNWLLVNSQDQILATGDDPDLDILRPLARHLAGQLLTYINSGEASNSSTEVSRGSLSQLDTTISQILGSGQDQIREAILRRRGIIHRLQLFTREYPLFIEPVYNGQGQATLALILRFDLAARNQAVLERYLTERKRAGKRDGIQIQAWPRPPQRDLLRERWFQTKPEAREMVRRADREQAMQTGSLRLDEKDWLACAQPLQNLNEWVLLGLAPAQRVEEEIDRRKLYFLATILFTLLAALLASWGLSRRLIVPIRQVQQGVRAIADEDYDYRMNLRSHDELGELSTTFNRMVAGMQEKERLSFYVSESVMDEVKKDTASGGGASFVTATILFTDIRNFTGLTERHSPGMIVDMLNEYLGRMSRVVRDNGGVVDKFIGDAVMAVFYPDNRPGARSSESRAVVAALHMRESMAEFNDQRRQEGKFPVETGIGIHTGEVIRGSIGAAEHRVDLTVIGDHVNLAARLESESRQGSHTRIYISDQTWSGVKDLIEAEPVELTHVKGKTQEVRIYEVVGLWKASDYIPWLTDAGADRRLQGLRLLGVIGDPVCLEAVRFALRDADPAVRREAALTLGAFPPDPIHSGLIQNGIDRESDPVTRATFVQVIGRIGTDEQKLELKRLFNDPDLRVQANAIEAIGSARDRERVVESLRDFTRHQNNRIRANTCVMLWTIGSTEGLAILLTMTRQKEPLMRASGCWGLGEICSPQRMDELRHNHPTPEILVNAEFLSQLDQCLDLVVSLLYDDNPMVVRNAARAIGRMGNRRVVDDLVKACKTNTDSDLRGVMLEALDMIGSFHVVRQLREELRG